VQESGNLNTTSSQQHQPLALGWYRNFRFTFWKESKL